VQGFYYMLTGVWPLVSLRSFEAVTGPKRDKWLVQTVGVLVAAIGLVLARAGARGRVTPDISLLAIASAMGLAAIDIVYVRTGTISRVYLLDALGETLLVWGWAAASRRSRRERAAPDRTR
jgi:hypothetical protein